MGKWTAAAVNAVGHKREAFRSRGAARRISSGVNGWQIQGCQQLEGVPRTIDCVIAGAQRHAFVSDDVEVTREVTLFGVDWDAQCAFTLTEEGRRAMTNPAWRRDDEVVARLRTTEGGTEMGAAYADALERLWA